MLDNGKVVIRCDMEYPNSYYYFNNEDGQWYGHKKSHFLVMHDKSPVLGAMSKILTKLAIKQGYPREIFKVAKTKNIVVHTHTKSLSKPNKKSSKPKNSKPKNSTFISLF